MKAYFILTINLFLISYTWGIKPDHPVIFIPGFMGSNLVDKNGELACCTPLNLVPGLATMKLPEKLTENPFLPQNIIDEYSVLGPFKVSVYDELYSTFSELGFKEGTDLFLFAYDWRLSNFHTAEKLHEFVEKQPQLKDRPFRIVGHSMGGIIARIFVEEYGDQHTVSSVVTMGTPYLGSLVALQVLLEGFGDVINFFHGGNELPKQVISTYPSIYELLPTYQNCCFVVSPGSTQKTPVDILNEDTWDQLDWFDTPPLPVQTRIVAWLAQARRLKAIMKTSSAETPFFKIVGSNFSTIGRVLLDEQGNPIEWLETNGDGVVIESSAANGNWAGTFAAIEDHSRIFNDEHVKILLKRLLTQDTSLNEFSALMKDIGNTPPSDQLVEAPLTRARQIKSDPISQAAFRSVGYVRVGSEGQEIPLATIKIETEDVYLQPGKASWVRVYLTSPGTNALLPLRNAAPIQAAYISGYIKLGNENLQSIKFAEVQPGLYEASYNAPSASGLYQIQLFIPNLGTFSEPLVVLPEKD